MKKRNILMSFLSLGILASCALPELPNMSFDFGNLTSSKNNNEDSKVTIILKADGGFFDNGKEYMEITVQFNEPIGYLPIPHRDGYLFVGWFDSQKNMYNETIPFKEDTTLYAKWEAHIHEYVQVENMGIAATCTMNGTIYEKCRTCGEETKTETPALGHQYGDSIVVITPTCESMGYERKQCVICQDEVINTLPALGHDIENMTVITPQTCTEGGEYHGICSRCGQDKEIYTEPLGHDIVLVGAYSESLPNEAQSSVYACLNGCGQAYLNFRSDQVTSDSAEHLVYSDDGGARFFGQPIGNDVQLNESGDADPDSHEPIFNVAQTGDYFEYAFRLTAAQVAALGPAQRLYCSAKAGDYMSGNRQDFWANDRDIGDWTPGIYVETTDTHEIGELCTNYRYMLYVDDAFQDFDPTITNPVTGSNTNQPIKEYVMPYTFHLHEGLNKIRLHMAGGYRSTFYNFTFRPYEDPNPTYQTIKRWNFDEITIDGSGANPVMVSSGDNGGYIQASRLLNQGESFTMTYISDRAMSDVKFRACVTYKNTATIEQAGLYVQENFEGPKYQLTVNGATAKMPSKATKCPDVGLTYSSSTGAYLTPVWVDYATINLQEGLNTIVLSKPNAADYRLYFTGFEIASII